MPKKAEVIFRQNVKQRDTRLSSFNTIYTKADNYHPTVNIYGGTSLSFFWFNWLTETSVRENRKFKFIGMG